MNSSTAVRLMDTFPDFKAPRFDWEQYNRRFLQANYIIRAVAKEVSYPEHWGSLSLKMAFGGNEFYEDGRCVFAVDDSNYLIFNEGKIYSSYICSKKPVESFTINFTPDFEIEASHALCATHQQLLDDPFFYRTNKFYFVEKLYKSKEKVVDIALKIKSLSKNILANDLQLSELYCQLFIAMLHTQQQTYQGIQSIEVIKKSTRAELYSRLSNARDFIYSCYQQPLLLHEIAQVACLSPNYFLRQFKHLFGMPPHRYLQNRRMEVAKQLLSMGSYTVSEVCTLVGYEDLTSFGKLFKNHYKMTPLQYRQIKKQFSPNHF